jgi:hypothetical protein
MILLLFSRIGGGSDPKSVPVYGKYTPRAVQKHYKKELIQKRFMEVGVSRLFLSAAM